MIAYLHKAPKDRANGRGYELRFLDRPSGEEFQRYRALFFVSGKREANALCKAHGVKPWNW